MPLVELFFLIAHICENLAHFHKSVKSFIRHEPMTLVLFQKATLAEQLLADDN